MRPIIRVFICFLVSFILNSCNSTKRQLTISNDLRNEAVNNLKSVLRKGTGWTKVHAAEYLIDLNYKKDVYKAFVNEFRLHGSESPYKIGIFRVLYESSLDTSFKNVWLDSIIAAYKVPGSINHIYTAETLAKINISPFTVAAQIANRDINSSNKALAIFTRWGKAPNDIHRNVDKNILLNILSSPKENDNNQRLAAYAIRHLDDLTVKQWKILARDAISVDKSSKAQPMKLSAAYVTAPTDTVNYPILGEIKSKLLGLGNSENKSILKTLCISLAKAGTIKNLPLLKSILRINEVDISENKEDKGLLKSDVELQLACSYAILTIDGRQEHVLHSLDWVVIVLYMFGMLIMGWFYSHKTKNTEDYLLGGRDVHPLAVGLSLFATLLSTLTFLAYPGEMIKHGPVIFTGLLGFPLVYYVVGWFLIPKFMQMKVTSAYEILEIRLGASIRMMAVFLFLILRFLWMATIVYATVNIIFLSILHIDKSYIWLISVLLMIITIVYTTLGGLKGVVMSDAVQAIILLSGALLVIIVVMLNYDSVIAWLPTRWLPHWSKLKFGFNLRERLTVGNAVLMLFVWYLCTAGSDQMAIQRYLSTKDIKTARKSFKISLITSMIAKVLLALVGLALIAFFVKYPYLLRGDKNIYEQADILFPRFIVIGLPVGVSGLVIVGLLAAAMSSLSSGINSTTSVISEDIIGKFWRKGNSISTLKSVKIISLITGLIVLILSLYVGNVKGNLFDVILKVVNLFVAPLFVLFFMALFIPFATTRATFIAGLMAVFSAIAIAFFEIFGITVLWILPFSLFCGITVGIILSYMDHLFVARPQ